MVATTASTSIFRKSDCSQSAVLVTGPRIREETTEHLHSDSEEIMSSSHGHRQEAAAAGTTTGGGLAVVEPESYRDVDVSSSSLEEAGEPASRGGSSNNPLRRFLQSNLFLSSKQQQQEEHEMEELDDNNNNSQAAAPVQISLPAHRQQREPVEKNYDICREYSYEDDDSDHDTGDDELTRHYFNDTATSASSSKTAAAAAALSNSSSSRVYLLGRTYHPINDYEARRNDESSLFWFTYRCDFPCIEPYGITSDAGWGCMLRALQMMMGQALRMHYKSRDWRPQQTLAFRRQDPFLRSVLTWFADFPSSNESIYSLHNMVAAGLAKYDKLPGEWYGPGTACYVLRDLVEIHEKQQQRNSNNNNSQPIFRVHVASGGTVYRDEIDNVVARQAKAAIARAKQKNQADELAHPLDMAWEEELVDPLTPTSTTTGGGGVLLGGGNLPWDTALLLLIPLRLGLKSFNTDYVEAIAHTFSLPQSVGVLGGRPRGARWFYGALSDGSKIFGLDPHTVQSAPKRRSARVNGQPSSVVEFSDEYMRSVHTTYTEVFSLSRMDPSIGLGFYCRNRADLEHVFSSLQQWTEKHPNSPDLFAVADKSPDYAVKDPAMDNLFESLLDEKNDKGDASGSEEDEFVML